MTKTKRLKDFEERARAHPEDVFDLGDLGSFINIHPMSDETEILSRLGIKPSSCVIVDLYWKYQGDVRFVEIGTRKAYPQHELGMHARIDRYGYKNILVTVPQLKISSKLVAKILKDAAAV